MTFCDRRVGWRRPLPDAGEWRTRSLEAGDEGDDVIRWAG